MKFSRTLASFLLALWIVPLAAQSWSPTSLSQISCEDAQLEGCENDSDE